MKRLSPPALCLLIAFTVAGCEKKGVQTTDSRPQATIGGVAIAAVSEEMIPETLELAGTVKATNSATLAARIPGTVTGILVHEGERVRKGKLLLTLQATESTAGAAGAAALVEEARRGVDEAVARRRLADATFERYQRLLKEEAVTRQEFESRQMEKEVTDQALSGAEARLAAAREAATAAGATAGYGRIVSPLAGLVTSKPAELGVTVFPGTPLITVEEEGNYRLELSTPESLAGKIPPGTVLAVGIDGASTVTSGKVTEVAPQVDPVTRAFLVKVQVAGPGLRSGMYGRSAVPIGTTRGILIPAGGLVERGTLTSVWVVGADHLARLRLVKTGRRLGDRVEILAGLKNGERVVTGGGSRITDGARVE